MGRRVDAALVVAGRTLAEPRLSPRGALGWLERRGDETRLVVDGAPVDADVRMPHPMGGGAWCWSPGGAAQVPPPDLLGALAADPVRALDAEPSPDGRWAVWVEWDDGVMPWQESRLVARPVDGSAPAVTLVGDPGVGVAQPRVSPDGARLAWVGDADGWRNVWVAELEYGGDGAAPTAVRGARPVAAEAAEHGGPTWGPGQRTFAWAPDGRSVAFARNEEGFGRLCVAHLDGVEVRELGRGWHWALSWAAGRIAALRSGARTPTQLVTYDEGTGERSVVAVGPDPAWAEVDLVEPDVVRWPSPAGDGRGTVEVPGRLYRPAGAAGPTPLLAWVHGGPTDQMTVTFNPRVAYFVDRGWSVLVPDHRGSSGWGRAWEDALRGRWGEVDVEDTAAGIRAALDRGWADPRRVVVLGGSAGGATALRVASRHPDVVAGAVALYPVVDLTAPSPSPFEARYHEWLVGDPWPVERLERPVLVLHGADDAVVPVEQSVGLRQRFPEAVTLHVYEGEGHTWKQPATVADELGRVEAFLAGLGP